MPAADDIPFRIAASLALDLIRERPILNDKTAADVAWHALRSGAPATFHEMQYAGEVVRMMQEILAGRATRIEPPEPARQRALEQLKASEHRPRR